MAKLQPGPGNTLDRLDAIAERYATGAPTGDGEVTVPLLMKRWGKRRATVLAMVKRMTDDGVLMYVRSYGALKIYRMVNAEQHHDNNGAKRFGVV